MGTRNFNNKNADYIYSIMPDLSEETYKEWKENNIWIFEEDWNEETNRESFENSQWEFFWDDLKEWKLPEVFNDIRKAIEKEDWVIVFSEDKSDNERNFSWNIFWQIYIKKEYKTKDKYWDEVFAEVDIELVCRSGYYEGCNLDFNIDVSSESTVWLDELPKWVENKKDKVVKIINDIYKEHTEAYNCMWTFSNWEWVYYKVN